MQETRCRGPCLRHCYCSPLVAALACIAIVYIGASVAYLAIVALMGFGTPFKDSLTDEQKCVMKRSRRRRRSAFIAGVLLMVLLLLVARPFRRGVAPTTTAQS